jgi:hypothetical protein
MRTREFVPCAFVAGDEPVSMLRRGAVFGVMILLWLVTFLIEGIELPALFAILAGAGITIDSGLRGSRALQVHLHLSVAVGDGAGRRE